MPNHQNMGAALLVGVPAAIVAVFLIRGLVRRRRRITLPPGWREILPQVDLELAKRELGFIIRVEQEEARAKGFAVWGKAEIVDATVVFLERPCPETAAALVELAPPYWRIFEACLPYGPFTREGIETALGRALAGEDPKAVVRGLLPPN